MTAKKHGLVVRFLSHLSVNSGRSVVGYAIDLFSWCLDNVTTVAIFFFETTNLGRTM
jgi:hypothetical protein